MSSQLSFFFERPTPPARQNLVIEAGAGTGKTTAIVAEVLKLLLENEELLPERIVLVTFTEKAAGEIADRIRDALGELDQRMENWPFGSPNPLFLVPENCREQYRRACTRQLARIDALRSQTIHSFCQSLLRMFPIEAGLDPQFKIIEGFERSLLYGQLYDAWVDEETRVNPRPEIVDQWEVLFAHVGYLFVIRDLVFSLIDRRDLLSETELDIGDFTNDLEPLLIEAVRMLRLADVRNVKDEPALRVVEYLRATEPPSFSGASTIEAWIEYLTPIASALRDVNLTRARSIKDALAILRPNPGECVVDRLASHRASAALLELGRRFVDFLDVEKRKLGVVDFDDLLLRTLAVLGDERVVERARAQFDFIFVDEFQDTDRTQARILDRLARDVSGGYVGGKTIVVGDPKQSIYGFRRADPETYRRTTGELLDGGARHQKILDQYRSDPPLLDAINSLFARLFPEAAMQDPNVFHPVYHALRAGKTESTRELDARITLLLAGAEEKADRHFAEAEAIAEWIESRRDGGELDLRRFAILFRRLTKLDDYLDTLDRYGIDYVLPPTRLFLDRRAPVDLVAVLRTIAYPFDLGAEISAARTPYFALTDEEIATGVLQLSNATPWPHLRDALATYREASRHLTVSALIGLIVETSGIESIYDAAADGVRHRRHLDHLRALAFEYDQKVGGSVRQFVDEIERRREEPDQAEPSLVDESRNAVRILSIHAAKGLEFETVILPDLEFNSNLDSQQLYTVEEPRRLVLSGRVESISANYCKTPGGEPLKDIRSAREEAENRRLFYVGVTRAQSDVVFVCHGKMHKKGFARYLKELFMIDDEMWTAGRRLSADGGVDVAFETMKVRGAARQRRRLSDAALEQELASGAIVDCTIPTPDFATESLIGEVRSTSYRATGVLLHRLLEIWDGRGDAEALLRRLALEIAADDETLARVRKRLPTIARSPMLVRIAAAETIGREFPVQFIENGEIVERRIDRLLRENGRELVVDYKSGTPHGEHRVQVQRYCAAIAAMTGRPCSGLLWYIDHESDHVVEVVVGVS